MKIRKGFVSNSSSSSFIVISDKQNYGDIQGYLQELVKENNGILVVDHNFGETEFGWDKDEYYDMGSKVIFAYLQTQYSGDEKHIKMLESVLKDFTGCDNIEWKIEIDYNAGENYGYIDHQSSAVEGKNLEIFDNELKLKNFLFDCDSYIQTGNDNDWVYEWNEEES